MKQNEVWLINLDPTVGAEIKKTRPAVIVNDNSLGKLPLKIIVPVTDWKEIYHLIILPMTSEGLDVVFPSVQSLARCQYPKEKMIVVLAIEQRVGAEAKEIAEKVKKDLGSEFFK